MWRKFFLGRYGMDSLSIAMGLLSLVFLNMSYLWIIGAGLIGLGVFRVTSKNIEKRRAELQKFDAATNKIRQLLAPAGSAIARGMMSLGKNAYGYQSRFKQRKSYVFVKCKNCRNTLRLPRNKGKLLATCPVCKSEFTIKT